MSQTELWITYIQIVIPIQSRLVEETSEMEHPGRRVNVFTLLSVDSSEGPFLFRPPPPNIWHGRKVKVVWDRAGVINRKHMPLTVDTCCVSV